MTNISSNTNCGLSGLPLEIDSIHKADDSVHMTNDSVHKREISMEKSQITEPAKEAKSTIIEVLSLIFSRDMQSMIFTDLIDPREALVNPEK